jgi:16S rRNA (guanine966-N2)-methyltransferase
VAQRADRFVAQPPATGWDLVLVDPPYEATEDEVAAVLGGLAAPGALADGAVVVVERSARSPEPTWPDGLERSDRRAYGETVVWFAGTTGA